VTGESITIPVPGTIHRMDRVWNDGDVVELEFPMTVRASRGHENSVSLELGPLLLALPRQEVWKRVGGGEPFGDWEIRTTEPWNYGIRQDDVAAPQGAFDVRRGDVPEQPWASGTAPGTLSAGPPIQVGCVARRVDEWQPYGVDTGPMPWSPIRSGHPDEPIILVPYGSTKIRISEFPVVI
ncbi:MAG: glycoside hydrolase family 127 protein, partial [Gemmatimonadales bacterium]